MKEKISAYEGAYRHSLHECLAGAGEAALLHGYKLGRQAMKDGLGVMDIISVQHKVTCELLADARTVDECFRLARISQDLFMECLAPFELTHRGFLEVESLVNKLEAANKELESFSYSVSHDLRAPLRAIDGYSRMILRRQEDRFDDETRRQFRLIRDNVKTMGRLIDDLLVFSRFGKQKMSMVTLDMEEIVREIWQNLLAAHTGRNMTLEVGRLLPAVGDRSLVREVFSNLLGNAVKFTQARDAARIEVGSSRKDGETVYYVRDNGIGFDMAYYDKLFGVFQRLHSEDGYDGTGLGLAIVQRIVLRQGGSVWAEGEIDKGASFYFSLPNETRS